MDQNYINLNEKIDDLLETEEIRDLLKLQKTLMQKRDLDLETQESLIKLNTFLIPQLSLEDFEKLVTENLVSIIKGGIDLKERMSTRVSAYGENNKMQEQIEVLRTMIGNEEMIKGKTIGAWLLDYDKSSGFRKKKGLERKNFLDSENFKDLSANEKLILSEILDLYDFIKPESDYRKYVEHVKENFDKNKKSIVGRSEKNHQDDFPQKHSFVQVNLSQALKQFPKIGEQLVTNSPLKIKVFPMPVRPSIKNWINDYHENLGMEKHGSIERGNFVFHSENAKRLSSQERQRLALILKSLEEETPLAIDTEKEEIDFEASVKEEASKNVPPKNQPLEQARITRQISSNSTGKPELKSSWDDFKSRMEKEAESDNFKFSSVHKFSSEHGNPARQMTRPVPKFAAKPEVKPEDSNPKIQGNIVDLRN